ncbi:MAG: rhodanese-like domain-containing protein [Ramlibacter sp.]
MISQVRPAALAAWIREQESSAGPALVLDVREPHELQRASVTADGFELLAIPMNSVPVRLAELDPGRPVACLCHHGARSQQVALYLEHNGFTRVANVAGGIDAWTLELDPSIPRY